MRSSSLVSATFTCVFCMTTGGCSNSRCQRRGRDVDPVPLPGKRIRRQADALWPDLAIKPVPFNFQPFDPKFQQFRELLISDPLVDCLLEIGVGAEQG